MTWVAHLVRTMNGRVGARLNLAGEGSWSIPLNGIEEFSVTVGKRQLSEVARDWWDMWRTSVMVSYQGDDGRLVPWVAGPITQPPSETRGPDGVVTLSCQGIGALLEKRVVLPRDYGMPGEYQGDMWYLAHANVERSGMSLGSIAQDIVELSTDRKYGGFLPIRFASPRETGSRLHTRTYEGFNLSNNGTWKRLGELSNVINGPDIAFRPEWQDDTQTLMQWAMYHGTVAQPAIEQAWTMDLDTTSSRAPVASVTPSTDASGLASRVYWTGAGEGAGTLIRMVQDAKRLQDHMPLIERVGSTSDSESASLVLDHANAALAAAGEPIRQMTIKISGSDQRAEIGRWRVGDLANVTIGNDWLTLPASSGPQRIIAAKGDWSTHMVDLEFQPDGEWYEGATEDGAEA